MKRGLVRDFLETLENRCNEGTIAACFGDGINLRDVIKMRLIEETENFTKGSSKRTNKSKKRREKKRK